jgi:hypothetical protein
MKELRTLHIASILVLGFIFFAGPVAASVWIGTGTESLLGGDLTDPDDSVKEREPNNYGADKSEEELRPLNGNWRTMISAPTSPPGTPPHQRHPYQSWQGSPACAIFLNNPEKRKWYLSFKDGGKGGPTRGDPYYCAVELKSAYRLTHFTVTTSPDMPDRDPKSWAIQGSNTGRDDDWTDIYKCDTTDRTGSPLRVNPRNETSLFTAFTSANMAKGLKGRELGKVSASLGSQRIEKADFAVPASAHTWFRIVIYSCFNPNSNVVQDFNRPPGFALGQVEFFGLPGKKRSGARRPPRIKKPTPGASNPVEKPAKPPVYDAPFIISYWCGPPPSETTLARYEEIAEAGFNVAFPAFDPAWDNSREGLGDEHNRKFLDLCQKVGIKGMIWAGVPLKDHNPSGWSPPTRQEMPLLERQLDDIISTYSKHPALLGYFLSDEPGVDKFARLGVINQYLLRKDPRHLPYINVLPNYAKDPDWLGSAYEGTIRRYLDTVKPALLSWDHYRQVFRANGDESYYWHNLEAIRRQSLRANVPCLQIICSLKHMGYRECSEADLRWQVYTSLAYGSRGIMYFTYWDVKGLAWADAPAIITMDGKRDVKYEQVKRINKRIGALGPTLLTLKSTGAYCTDPLPPGGVRLAADAPVTKAEGGSLLIGCFRDAKGRRFIFPVNRSFRSGVTARLTLDSRTLSVSEISQETGKPMRARTLPGGVLDVPLDAGEGRLFKLNPRR